MPTPYPNGRIYECATCHVTCVVYGVTTYEWATGAIHDCSTRITSWLDVLTADALDGDKVSARILPEAINEWLLGR